MRIDVVTWSQERPSGGNVYNAALVAALRDLGAEVGVHRLPGTWPNPSAADLDLLAATLRRTPLALVDGVVACAAPEQLRAAAEAGALVSVLVHMSLGASGDLTVADRQRLRALEGRALRTAHRVFATSRHAAAELRDRHGLARVHVAAPGVRPAALAPGSRGAPRLLCVAAVIPDKGHLVLVRALAQVTDLAWTAHLVGSTEAAPEHAARVRAAVRDLGLEARVLLTGALVGERLEREWRAGDLLVLPSRHETFALVVTEALARGIPAVVGAGTGAVEALDSGRAPLVGTAGESAAGGTAHAPDAPRRVTPSQAGADRPGTAVPPGDHDALARALRAWLTTPELRERWRAEALRRRDRLPRWSATAREVLTHLA